MIPLEQLLGNAIFAEDVSMVPAGGAESDRIELVARVIREAQTFTAEDGRQRAQLSARVKVLATAHPDFGGLSAPMVGDTWRIAKRKGGDLVDGWIAGPARGFEDAWEIPVTLMEYAGKGGRVR